MSVTEVLCGTVLSAPDRESQGLWGQEQRASPCPARWEGLRGKVELGGVDWNGRLGSVLPVTHHVTSLNRSSSIN